MARGRCAGCGREGAEKAITGHVTGCPQYQSLFAAEPGRALAPAAEYQRYVASGDKDAAKEAYDDRRTREGADLQGEFRRREQDRWGGAAQSQTYQE